jgi:hypothetical protein
VEVFARLPASWLYEVWGGGLAAVDEWFVLGVADRPSADRVLAVAVSWQAASPDRRHLVQAHVACERTKDGWAVRPTP